MNVKLKAILDCYREKKAKSSYLNKAHFPPSFIDSVLCIEDRRFYRHFGIDFIAIIRAFITNLLNRKIVEGASTITQQLIRHTVLSSKKSYRRKMEEVFLSILIERKLTKDEILEFYLNTCYLARYQGKNVYGIFEAAKAVFGLSSSLNLSHASFLAALIGRPLSNHMSDTYFLRTIYRQHLILNLLYQTKKITKEQMIEAKKEDIPLFNRKKGDFPIENLNGYGSQYCKPKFLMGKYLRIAVYTIRK